MMPITPTKPLRAFTAIESEQIRSLFPILGRQIYGKQLVYFDNGATTQKPQRVLDSIQNYYTTYNSNVHRGVHFLSQQATDVMEDARKTIQEFINAKQAEEIIFTSGATESINLLASSFSQLLAKGDEILISAMEHHANIVPWQMICERYGYHLRVIPILDNGDLDLIAFDKLITPKTKLLSVVQVSNTLGTINPIKQLIDKAHQNNTAVIIDGSQAVQHLKIDVQELDCDFYVFSGHKLYGPTGTGVLYGKKNRLEQLPPYKGGGDMIREVSFEKTTYNDLPFKFEAGTPNIEGIIGLAEAIHFINHTGIESIANHEADLLNYFTDKLRAIPGIRIFGESSNKIAVISFLLRDIHPYDIGVLLDKMGIAVRTGHHCTQPIMQRYQIPGTVRASLAVYNIRAEIDVFIDALHRINKMF
ncbi:MAG: aminotransferase class V-fold PLP-dependent enzyme [Bacteroidota bacterium]